MSEEKIEEPWPPIRPEERTLHEILFYSQGPVDGYILGEGIRDLLLKSGLSLTVLSQIWNLADTSNDNVLNVHEFVLIMHLIRGVVSGRSVPKALPRTLIPPKTSPQSPPPMTQQEKDAYLRVFQTLDYNRAGLINAPVAAEMFLASKLPTEVLAQIWDLSEFGRDGKLNPEKFAVACHLLRYAKHGGSLDGPVDIFQYAPQHISPVSLLARKRRVSEYEEHKQRLMTLKERRKIQAVREARRLDLAKEKVECLQELLELLNKLDEHSETASNMSNAIQKDKADNEKQEEIALRLKKEHEKVRQETVKIILGEQKFSSDISIIKKDTDELNKRLLSAYTHATKDPDPFHQLFEQRKEKRQGSTIKDLDKIDMYIPFEFSPFDLSVNPDTLPSGMTIMSKGNNHKQSVAEIQSVIEDLKEFDEQFMDLWGETASLSNEKTKEFEDDEVFREVYDWSEDNWASWDYSDNGLLGLTDHQIGRIKQRLCDVLEEMRKLNSEGGRLVFRNSEDYQARKRALKEEERVEKGRIHRRSVTQRLRTGSVGTHRTRDPAHIHSSSVERKVCTDSRQAAQAAREYRLKRRSQTFDSASSSPEILRKLDRDRRLYRTSTDLTSVSDEDSLSRQSSLSSFDHPFFVRESCRLDEESSVNRTQCSSRTDDSGNVTLKSDEHKDDFCIESSSQLQQHLPNVRSTDALTLSETAKLFKVRDNVNEHDLVDDTRLSMSFAEPNQKDKEQFNHDTLGVIAISKPTSPVVVRTSSKKHRAPAPPSSASLDTSLNNKPLETDIHTSNQNQHVSTSTSVAKLISLECSSNNEGIPSAHTTHVTTVEPLKRRSHLTGQSSNKESTNLPKTETTPQRPPRLKKQSVSSEHSNGPPTPPVLSSTDDLESPVKEIYSTENLVIDLKSTSKTKLSEVKNKEVRNKESNNKTGIDFNEQTNINQISSCVNSEVEKSVSGVHFSFDQRSIELTPTQNNFNQEQKNNKQPDLEDTSLLTYSKSNKTVGTVKAIDKLTEMDDCFIKSETKTRTSQTPATLGAIDISEVNNVELSIDFQESRKVYDDDIVPGSPFHAEGAPPPLPNSAPPALPASMPPTTIETSAGAEEEVTVEYTVPVTLSSNTMEYNHTQKFHESDSSFPYLDSSSEVSSQIIVPTAIPVHSEVSSADSQKDSKTNTGSSTPKTISDLRSDFFGLKSRRSNVDFLEINLIATPTSISRNTSFDDYLTEDMSGKHFGHGNSVDSDVSDTDSGVPMSLGDVICSPGDSCRHNLNSVGTRDERDRIKTSFISSERRYVLSNDSTESAFEDSLSVSSTSSVKLSQIPIDNLSDLTTSANKSLATSIQVNQSYSSLPSSVVTQNSSVSLQTNNRYTTSSAYTNQKRNSDNLPSVLNKDKRHISSSGHGIVEQIKPLREDVQSSHTVKLTNEGVSKTAEDTSKSNFSDLEMQRRDVIAQSMVSRKFTSAFLPADDAEDILQESVPGVGKSLRSSNPSEYGFVYSAERPKPPPEVGWSEKQAGDQNINLYSENVLKEANTTESVDRESIANLATTKRQWENIFTSHTSQVDTSTKKKTSPKWEVRLPYSEKRSVPSANHNYQITEEVVNNHAHFEEEEDSIMFKKPAVTESAIEREIRLAHEREDMLRQEKEERQKLLEKQKSQSFIASYATSSAESESNQPAYNELTEADRNPDLWAMEHEDRNKEDDDESDANDDEINPNESIIEREIRLQREREAEVARMRKLAEQQLHPQQHESLLTKQNFIQYEEEDINHNQKQTLSDEQSTVSSSNEVENRIVRELRELKEREEEIRRLHSSLHRTQITDEIDGEASTSSQKTSYTTATSPQSSQVSWQKDVSSYLSPQRRESVDSTSSHSTVRSQSDTPSRRDIKVRPIADSYADEEEQKTNYFKKQETPIWREMRLARERENDLRRQKGLPEIDTKDENPYSSFGADQASTNSNSVSRPLSVANPSDSMKKFASSRLQQELQEQRDRELILLNEGKIITTSEQHIQPLKFLADSGVDSIDGALLKRNFAIRKSTATNNESDGLLEHQDITSLTGQSARKAAVGAGGQLFSYREFKQTAESKIETELREMKEREEELRKQRAVALSVVPQ